MPAGPADLAAFIAATAPRTKGHTIEIYFSIVQRKVLTPNDSVDLVEVEQRLLGFQRRYQQAAMPFDWRFTRSDLDRLLRRLDDQEQLTKAA